MISVQRGLAVFCLWLPVAFVAPVAVARAPDAAVRPAGLPPPVRAVLKQWRIPRKSLSVYVHRVGAGEPAVAWRSRVPRNPASTIKLLTTFVALDELGPAYKWKTEAYVREPVTGGVLKGDLYIKGYGDPYLVTEYFWRMLRGLRHNGLQHITGDLVLDHSFFDVEDRDPGEFDGRPYRSYNASPAALMLNFQSINFRFRPDVPARRLEIIADPDPGAVIDNRVRLVRGGCRRWQRKLKLSVVSGEDGFGYRFSGRYPSACGERGYYRRVADGARYFYGVFSTLWRELGGFFNGGFQEDRVPDEAELYYRSESLALADIIRAINKYSNNVMTQQLLLTLAAERFGPPGTTEKGVRAIEEWLQNHGFSFPELVLDNGAGLSRETRISAEHLGRLLLFAYRSPYMPEFMSSLPISARDGTVRKRYVGTELDGRLHVKTGLLDDVRGLAGYVLDARDRRWVVVVLHNHPKASGPAGEAVQDAVLRWLYRFSNADENLPQDCPAGSGECR